MAKFKKYGRWHSWILLVIVTQISLHAGVFEYFTMSILLDCYFLSGVTLFVHWMRTFFEEEEI